MFTSSEINEKNYTSFPCWAQCLPSFARCLYIWYVYHERRERYRSLLSTSIVVHKIVYYYFFCFQIFLKVFSFSNATLHLYWVFENVFFDSYRITRWFSRMISPLESQRRTKKKHNVQFVDLFSSKVNRYVGYKLITLNCTIIICIFNLRVKKIGKTVNSSIHCICIMLKFRNIYVYTFFFLQNYVYLDFRKHLIAITLYTQKAETSLKLYTCEL